MNPNLSKICLIIFTSIAIAITYNHLNPNGIDLIRKERVLQWENDSLDSFNKIDSLITENKLANPKRSVDTVLTNNKNNVVEGFTQPKAIKLDFAYKLFKQGFKFIDARSPEEFAEGHIRGAVNVPFYGSENYTSVLAKLNKNEIIVTYCESAECDISTLSGDELFEMGFKKVYVFIGGYAEWTKYNYSINAK